MTKIMGEVADVTRKNYNLEFVVPTRTELLRIRRIHRDRSKKEQSDIKRVEQWVQDVTEGDLPLDSLAPELRANRYGFKLSDKVRILLALWDSATPEQRELARQGKPSVARHEGVAA